MGFNIKQFKILKHLTFFLKSNWETSIFNIEFFLVMSLWLASSVAKLLFYSFLAVFLSAKELQNEAIWQFWVYTWHHQFWFFKSSSHPLSKSMCGCGCSIISSLMKRLSRSTCCSDLFSCSHTSDQLQRLSIECPRQPKVTTQIYFR